MTQGSGDLTWREKRGGNEITYRTVQHAVSLVSALLDVVLQSSRVKRLQQLKATQELGGDRHNRTPVVKFTAIL